MSGSRTNAIGPLSGPAKWSAQTRTTRTGLGACSVPELSIRRARIKWQAAHIFAANQVEHSMRCAFGGKHGHHKAKSESCQARPGGNVQEPACHRGRGDVHAR